jgi:xylulose-5-phosphate/fructose-6-phosphate phosphoketolase
MQEAASESKKVDVLNGQELSRLDAYWRAANYLSVGQIYLLDNPLLRDPLKPEHIKPRLLGHWGTTPGLNFIYAHLNRVIKAHDPQRHLCLRPWSWRSRHGGQYLS